MGIAALLWALGATATLGFYEKMRTGLNEGWTCFGGTLLAFYAGTGRDLAKQGLIVYPDWLALLFVCLALMALFAALWSPRREHA